MNEHFNDHEYYAKTTKTTCLFVQKCLSKLIKFDKLTGLPDYEEFKRKAAKALEVEPGQNYVIVLSDIINFKYINYAFGYETGNAVLCAYAKFLRDDKNNVCVCRLFSDHFVYLRRVKDFTKVSENIIDNNKKFSALENRFLPDASLLIASGICVLDKDRDIKAAVDKSNIAKKTLKDYAKIDCAVFKEEMALELRREMEITNLMAKALKNKEFIIYLQPKVSLKNYKMVGAEALVRWRKANGEILQPMSFIPLFENNGFIVELDLFVCEEVCKLLRSWLDSGKKPLPISVNLSRKNFKRPGFLESIIEITNKYAVPHQLLEFELTESVFIENVDAIVKITNQFKKLGFGFSVDDFGAGYTSFDLIKSLPVDVLKLDKSFFSLGKMACRETILLANIVRMAKELDMLVLCEGVENEEQMNFLASIGCDLAQGYLFDKPMTTEKFFLMIC